MALNSRTGALKTEKRGRFEAHVQREDAHMKTEAESGGKQLQARTVGVSRSHQKLEERYGMESISELLVGTSRANTLILDFWPKTFFKF